MNTKQLPYIIAIAETGSLSKAAIKLGISQPALSKYITGLEAETGLRMFVREKQRMLPTEAGAAYIDTAHKIMNVQQQTHNAIVGLFVHDRKCLRIGVTPHRGAQQVAIIQPHLIKQFPEYELVTHESYNQSLKDKTRSGELDLSFITLFKEEAGLHHLCLFAEEAVLSVPAFHKLAELGSQNAECARRIDIARFQDSPFVFAGEQTSVGQILEHTTREAGFEPVAVFRANNILAVVEMIRSGAGVGLIPLRYAAPSDDVVYFRLKEPTMLQNCVATQKGRKFSKVERYLIYLDMLLYNNSGIPREKITWSDELRAIVLEFDPQFFAHEQEAEV